MRLDPFALPAQFAVSDIAADDQVRHVELHRERVVVRRAVRGMRMALNLPVSAYLGIAIRISPPVAESAGAVIVTLEHRDHALSIPLSCADDASDLAAQWQAWSRTLGLPLLIAGDDGSLREAVARIGALRVGTSCGRRRRRSAIKWRRPSILMRRRAGRREEQPTVHCDEREIIARN